MRHHRNTRTLLAANRGAISNCVARAAHEPGIKTLSIDSQQDHLSLRRRVRHTLARFTAGRKP